MTAASVETGAAHIEGALGQPMGPGGQHERMATHNRLVGLDGPYLEAIAADPDAPSPGRPRWYNLDNRTGGPAFDHWAVRVDDLDAAVATFPNAGEILSFARGDLRWRMAVPPDGRLPFDGCFPALLQWDTAPPAFPDIGLRLEALSIRHPHAGALRKALDGLLSDARITVADGPAGLRATIATPDGLRELT